MKNILAVVSGKGGAGKSTCSLGIATALCKMDKRVLLIDLDAGLRCLDLMTGVDEQLVFDLGDVLDGKFLSDAMLEVSAVPGLYLVAAPRENRIIDGKALTDVLLSARGFDFVILDFPAGIDFPFCKDLRDMADFIIVSGGDKISARDSENMAISLMKCGCDCRIIINRFERRPIKRGFCFGIDDIIDRSGCRLLGVVPFDRKIARTQNGVLRKKATTKNAFRRIAKRIYGYELPLPGVKKIEKGK